MGEEAEELRLDFADLKKIDQSITSPRPPRMFRLTEKRHFDTHAGSSGLAAADGFNLLQQAERERSESMQSHKFGLMHLEELNNDDLLLRTGVHGADYHGDPLGHDGDYDTVGANDTIFAVNSDFYFLYMVGKMCNESGHNLFQGLLALNDYYLFCWHYGQRNVLRGDDRKHAPLTTQSARTTSGHRIQDCVKTLLCMAEICEKLHQPRLALNLFLKILEDRETLIKYLGCKKWVLSAEAGLGRVWSTISWQQPEARARDPSGRSKDIVGGIQDRISLLEDHFSP